MVNLAYFLADKLGMRSGAKPQEQLTSDTRRRAYRQPLLCNGMLYRDNRSAGPQRITVKDCSMLGVGFETGAPVEPGTRCRLNIELGPTRIVWRVRVVCCGKIDDTLYRIGCDFIPQELDRSNAIEIIEAADENEVLLLA